MKNAGLILWSSVLSICLFMVSCERSEGEGGKSTIEGFVYKIVDDGTVAVKDSFYTDENGVDRYKFYSFERDTIPAVGEDVYIIYGGLGGNEREYDRVRTLYNGKYSFPYLVEGNYTVYALNNLPNKVNTAEFESLKIGKKGVHKVPDIYIRDGKNAGLSAIVGQIRAVYDPPFSNPDGRERMDVRVYLRREGTVAPLEDARTDDKGYFVFTKLTPGKYIIWAATEGYTKLKDQPDAEYAYWRDEDGVYQRYIKLSDKIVNGTGQIVVIEDPIVIRLTYEKN